MFLWIHFKKKLRGISEIEKFYMEDCPNTSGYTLEYILGQSDSWLEQKHDYIQWLSRQPNPAALTQKRR